MTFETRAALFAWLEQQGLAHVARFNLEAVAPWVDQSLWKQLRSVGARRRLTDPFLAVRFRTTMGPP